MSTGGASAPSKLSTIFGASPLKGGRAVVNGAAKGRLRPSGFHPYAVGGSAADIRSAAKGRRKSFCRRPCPQPNSVLAPATARSRAVLRLRYAPYRGAFRCARCSAGGMTAPKE